MVIESLPGKWEFYGGDVFYNPRKAEVPTHPVDVLKRFGFTTKKMMTELFRINGGRLGYYLANLRDKKYYYCGEEEDSVKAKLLELGIGKIDPMEAN
ncbi:MAG: hypothetical protein HC916_18600 [Coleofasciculaceae cyanobacterium SM2_1_6]|nr:hypothetical protein [Coleofasciculaceae cyanobacterium SM2_1_6]